MQWYKHGPLQTQLISNLKSLKSWISVQFQSKISITLCANVLTVKESQKRKKPITYHLMEATILNI